MLVLFSFCCNDILYCVHFDSQLSGCRDQDKGKILKRLFQTSYFRIVVVPDEETVELCGALKVVNFFSNWF